MQGLCHISELGSGWLAKAENVRKCHDLFFIGVIIALTRAIYQSPLVSPIIYLQYICIEVA